jgi:hypothetical protein
MGVSPHVTVLKMESTLIDFRLWRDSLAGFSSRTDFAAHDSKLWGWTPQRNRRTTEGLLLPSVSRLIWTVCISMCSRIHLSSQLLKKWVVNFTIPFPSSYRPGTDIILISRSGQRIFASINMYYKFATMARVRAVSRLFSPCLSSTNT